MLILDTNALVPMEIFREFFSRRRSLCVAVNNSKYRNSLPFNDNEPGTPCYSPVIHKYLNLNNLCKKIVDGFFAFVHRCTSSLKARE
jgi:hypothetical protein